MFFQDQNIASYKDLIRLYTEFLDFNRRKGVKYNTIKIFWDYYDGLNYIWFYE